MSSAEEGLEGRKAEWGTRRQSMGSASIGPAQPSQFRPVKGVPGLADS